MGDQGNNALLGDQGNNVFVVAYADTGKGVIIDAAPETDTILELADGVEISPPTSMATHQPRQ